MTSFLLATSYNWVLAGVLVVLLGLWLYMTLVRKKKDDAYRKDLESQIRAGAKVKTYSGLYATVISVTETTDGKIVLVKTGEGNNASYQSLHMNAIYGLDTKQTVSYDAEGNLIAADGTIVRPAPVVAPVQEEKKEEKPAVKEEKKVEEKKEVKTPAKKPAAKKSTTKTTAAKKAPAKSAAAKTSTTKKSSSNASTAKKAPAKKAPAKTTKK